MSGGSIVYALGLNRLDHKKGETKMACSTGML
jgi:hypothetical protein